MVMPNAQLNQNPKHYQNLNGAETYVLISKRTLLLFF